MRFSNFLTLAVAALLAQTSATLAKPDPKLTQCSVDAVPTTCPKGQYCQATKTYSYCYKKQDGGAECDKDDACKSGICFIAKKLPSGKMGKRTCAAVPTKNFALHARCTLSSQCTSGFCDDGFCKKPVPAGQSCPKDVGCEQHSKGAVCLKKPATFIVYDKAGKKSTEKLKAGKCNYIRNLGLGMDCTSNINCYADKFECSKKTKKCVALPTMPPIVDLPYNATCSANTQCASSHCLDNICGCKVGGKDCDDRYFFCRDAVCEGKGEIGDRCVDQSNDSCKSNVCVQVDVGDYRCGCGDDDACDEGSYCNVSYNQCGMRQNYGSDCTRDRICSSNVCLLNGNSTGSCGCAADSDCSGGATCDTNTNQCGPEKLPYYETCTTDDECKSDICSDGRCGCLADNECPDSTQWCNPESENMCVAKNGPSGFCYGGNECLSGLCNGDNSCGCTTDSQCSDGNLCDTTSHTCKSPNLPLGTSCQFNQQCASHVCADLHCGCASDADCDPGSQYCSDSSTCDDKLPYGETCSRDSMCTNDVCTTPGVGRRSPAMYQCGCTNSGQCGQDEFCDNSNLCAGI